MDPEVRGRAAWRLGEKRDMAAPAVPFLVAMLYDDFALRWEATLNEDPFERVTARMNREEKTSPGREAAKALIKLGSPSKDPLLDALAKDNRLPVIRNAALALGALKEMRAVPLLVPLLNAERLAARCSVPRLAALSDQERTSLSTAAAKALGDELDKSIQDQKVLKDKMEEKLESDLKKKLKEEDTKTVIPDRVKALREGLQKQVKDDLVKQLRADLVATRVEIAKALGRLKATEAVDALIAALGDPKRKPLPEDADWEVRRDAAMALGVLGDARAVEPLVARLDDRTEVRTEVEKALMDIREPSVVDLAVGKLSDADPAVRRVAVRLLNKFRERRTLPVLIDHVQDEAPDVQFEVLTVLRAMSGQDFPPMLALWKKWWETEVASDKLNPPPESLVDVCTAALKGEAWATRVVAARNLGIAGDRRAVPGLIEALADKEPWVRKTAAQSLGSLGDPHAVEALIGALKDTDGGVQIEAQIALRAFSEQDYGRDTGRWSEWWQANKESLLAKAERQAGQATKETPEKLPPVSQRPPARARLGLLLLLAMLAVCPIAILIVVRYAQRRR
jgi:HEAT repeat protein